MGQQSADLTARTTTGTAVAPPPAAIDNPVINSPFRAPTRHFTVVDGQVTGDIVEGRRPSEFFVPVAAPKKKSPQMALQFGAGIRQQPNEIVNEIRFQVGKWREQEYPHTTSITRELLTADWADSSDWTRELKTEVQKLVRFVRAANTMQT